MSEAPPPTTATTRSQTRSDVHRPAAAADLSDMLSRAGLLVLVGRPDGLSLSLSLCRLHLSTRLFLLVETNKKSL